MYNVIDKQTVKVFHADKCTKEHRTLINIIGRNNA
jgi:hypothetical protein